MSSPTLEQIKETAAQYQTKTQFKEAHPGMYKRAWRKGWLDEVCAHMGDARKKWTREKILEAALRYQTRSDFMTHDPRAYHAARYRGWLDHVCQHMYPTEDVLYLCRVTDTNIFKIGVTSQHLGLARIETLSKKCQKPLELVLYVPFSQRIRDLETELLLKGRRVEVEGVKSGEFREFSPSDLKKVMSRISESLVQAHT